MNELQIEIAQVAARLIAEEGWPWSGAKQRALRELGLPPRTALPGSDLVEDMLREHLALFQADTQPAELLQLRRLALRWMERLECFEPLLTGAVWRGTANGTISSKPEKNEKALHEALTKLFQNFPLPPGKK